MNTTITITIERENAKSVAPVKEIREHIEEYLALDLIDGDLKVMGVKEVEG